jgi:hypothetical protein
MSDREARCMQGGASSQSCTPLFVLTFPKADRDDKLSPQQQQTTAMPPNKSSSPKNEGEVIPDAQGRVFITDPTSGIITGDLPYDQRLFRYTWNAGGDEPHFMAFRSLQRLNVVHIQNELASKKRDIVKKGAAGRTDMEELKVLLQDYGMEVVQPSTTCSY